MDKIYHYLVNEPLKPMNTNVSFVNEAPEVSVVMPCLNEEESIGSCINKALHAFKMYGISGKVIVADNGSTDNSVQIAQSLGAIVVHQPIRGYGAAYLAGFAQAKRYVIRCMIF